MNDMERACLQQAVEELAYRRTAQYKLDQEIDRIKGAQADRKVGHSPLCSLTKCHPTCKR